MMTTEKMESWRMVWRKAVVPLMSLANLEVLKWALENDDPRLVQGTTTNPPHLHCTQCWPVEAACLLTYPGVLDLGGFKTEVGGCTVLDAEEFFAGMCIEIDNALGEPAGCWHLLSWFDETPRPEMIAALLPEVELALCEKGKEVQWH